MKPAQIEMLMATAPTGAVVVFVGADSGYCKSMREIFRVPGEDDDVVLARKGSMVWVVVPSNLVVRFTMSPDSGDDEIIVEPYLVVADPAEPFTWSAPPGFAQPAIDLTSALLLRVAPTGRPQ